MSNTTPIIVIGSIIAICCMLSSSSFMAFGDRIPYINDQIKAKPENKNYIYYGGGSGILSCICVLFLMVLILLMQQSKK